MLELGSGPGLAGFVAARWAQSVLLTDYQDLVLDLLRINVSKCNPRPTECSMHIANLNWCELDLETQVFNSENTSIGPFKD